MTTNNYSELNQFIPGIEDGQTPLIRAIERNSVKTIETILELTKNASAKSEIWYSPLYYMCYNGKMEENNQFLIFE